MQSVRASRLICRKSNRLLTTATLLTLAIMLANPCNADELSKVGKNKVAEMTAFVRHNEICPEVPQQWSTAFMMLLMMAAPSEEQVEDQERQVVALRDQIGQTKWCQLYAIEMQEAFIVYNLAAHH